MTYLLLQAFLLMTAAYLLGAFLGCWLRRAFVGVPERVAVRPGEMATAGAAAGAAVGMSVPRSEPIPVQPRIEHVDPPEGISPATRFERALSGVGSLDPKTATRRADPVDQSAHERAIESAAALFLIREIAQAHPRVIGCLMASEDMTADLGAPRSREGTELAFARAHFHAACTAAGMISIDYPYTFSDIDGLQRNCAEARALGYKAKSLVAPEHGAAVNAAFTPSHEECLEAARIVEAFEAARKRGEDRAHLDGHLVEVPTYRNALAVIARAAELDRFA